jgi:hypothetical protein
VLKKRFPLLLPRLETRTFSLHPFTLPRVRSRLWITTWHGITERPADFSTHNIRIHCLHCRSGWGTVIMPNRLWYLSEALYIEAKGVAVLLCPSGGCPQESAVAGAITPHRLCFSVIALSLCLWSISSLVDEHFFYLSEDIRTKTCVEYILEDIILQIPVGYLTCTLNVFIVFSSSLHLEY